MAAKRPRVKTPPAPRRGSSTAAHAPVNQLPPSLQPMSPAQMVTQASQIAGAQVAPQLAGVDQARSRETSAHTGRSADLGSWNAYQQQQLNQAFTDTRDALNQVVSSVGASGQQSQDALAAALRSGDDRQAQLARLIGAAPVQSNDAAILAASKGSQDSANKLLGADVTSQIGAAGAARGLAGVTGSYNLENERRRNAAAMQGLQDQEQGIRGQIPGLVNTSLNDLRQFEGTKQQLGETRANDLFQQYLAEQQLGQSKKDQTFQQWLARQQLSVSQQNADTGTAGVTGTYQGAPTLEATKFAHQSAIDWANVGINRTQAEGQLYQMQQDVKNAKNTADQKKAQLRGDAYSKALQWLGQYLTPGKDENPKSASTRFPYAGAQKAVVDPTTYKVTTPAYSGYRRTFQEALTGMTQFTSRSDALRILAASNYTDWSTQAKQMLNRLKRRVKSGGDRGVSGTAIPGGSGASGYGGAT